MEDDPKPTPPEPTSFKRLWSELKRRHVVRVAMVYAIVGWLVIQVAVSTFPRLSIPSWAESLVIMAVILGFPISLVVAWAFELTPEGIKTSKTARVEHPESHKDSSHAKKRHWFSLGLAAAVPTVIFSVLALFFYVRSGSETESPVGEKSIAVLPLENMSPDPDNAFFASGVHEDILTNLSYIKSLTVIARTSVMRYQDTNMSMSEIGEELGVRYLLEGSVRKAGNRIKVAAQLIDSHSEGRLWADDYDRELSAENVFEIQAEISVAIAKELKAILSPQEQERLETLPTQNLAALEAYFKGKELLGGSYRTASVFDYKKAILSFKEAIRHDPNFALAHVALGETIRAHGELAGLPRRQLRAEIELHVKRALELDPDSSEVLTALGRWQWQRRDLEAAELAFQKAIESNPNNSAAYGEYGSLFEISDPQKAFTLYRKAYELNPNGLGDQLRMADGYESTGQLEKALELRKSTVSMYPDQIGLHVELGTHYGYYSGDFVKAIISYRKAYALDPENITNMRIIFEAHVSLGDFDKAVWWIDKYLENNKEPSWQAYWKCSKFNLTGDEKALEKNALEGMKIVNIQGSGRRQRTDFLWHLTEIAFAKDQPENVRSLYVDEHPALFDPSPEIRPGARLTAKNLARVLMATGEREQANRLIEKLLPMLRSGGPHFSFLNIEAGLQAIAGDDRKALDAIRRYLDAGGSPYKLMLYDELKRFENYPEYQEMAEKRKAELAIQLDRIRKMEANGELALIPELPAN